MFLELYLEFVHLGGNVGIVRSLHRCLRGELSNLDGCLVDENFEPFGENKNTQHASLEMNDDFSARRRSMVV